MFYRHVLRPLLYALPAETAHRLVLASLALAARIAPLRALVSLLFGRVDPRLRVSAFGLSFPNPIGLAAGLDKDAEAFPMFAAFGFGFVEVGTLTAQAQPGNPQPRLFRLPGDRALINRMGFNNHGATAAVTRLAKGGRRSVPLGINIGKTKLVQNHDALDDYARSAELLGPLADYLVINVSSPNTPGLRDLQQVNALEPLLRRMRAVLDARSPARRVPLLLKIAPDLADEDLDAIAELALTLELDGIIATNTTVGRKGLASPPEDVAACGAGGLSGAPLKLRSLSVLRRLHARLKGRVVIVSAGGVESTDDVWDRLEAGASLVQLYTALIYDGPLLPWRLRRELSKRLRAAGMTLDQLRGA
jgi:dihydroorotate dehydrogenase